MSIKSLLLFLTFVLSSFSSQAALIDYKIVTAGEHGTYMKIGKDLAKYVGEAADINLTALQSSGSVENVKRLREEQGTKLALVQSDVYQAFTDLAAKGNRDAMHMINPLRVIMPLYDEEIYFIVRADSPLNFIHEIQDAKINIGPMGSGSAMSATTLYGLMFGTQMTGTNATTLGYEDALVKMVKDKTIDVVILVAGQPTPLIRDVEPGAEKHFKFLKLNPVAKASINALNAYPATTIKATSYPNWLTADIPTHSVKTLLVTYEYQERATRDALVRFGTSLCQNFSTLQTEGHPKWQQVSLQLPSLPSGWRYFSPTEKALRSCRSPAKKVVRQNCTLQEEVMGFCKVK